MNYKKTLARIDEIVEMVENNEPDIDELIELVKEATQLIGSCRDKLQNAEKGLRSSLDRLS